ncbi:MAG TPA: hypothetical protein VND41_05550 [Nitrososphaerales archaeon]|nr:hypothetical protein [Nitrososphaerales archaeon]
MNKAVTIAGALVCASGFAMFFLVGLLHSETYRAAIVIYQYSAIVVSILGAGALVAGVLARDMPLRSVDSEGVARFYFRLALINTISAALFAAPLLDPQFKFPILITRWPGIYMVVAYTFFVLVGVFGMLGWGVFFHLLPSMFDRASVRRFWLVVQVAVTEVGVYALAIFMFLGGYIGASLNYSGAGDFIVGAQMEVAVIPSALGIFLVMLGTMIGVANILLAKSGT